jgi:hypothetical protein
VPRQGAQLLSLRSLIYGRERADSKNHDRVPRTIPYF